MKLTLRETINALKIIRKSRCAYGADFGKLCDCKFGVKLTGPLKTRLPYGEKGSGCPELYQAIFFLEELEMETL